jgi:hypothetical protein
MTINSYHVVPALNGGWSVRKYGSERATRHFETKEIAEAWARQLCIKQKVELVIHKRDGTVQSKDRFDDNSGLIDLN